MQQTWSRTGSGTLSVIAVVMNPGKIALHRTPNLIKQKKDLTKVLLDKYTFNCILKLLFTTGLVDIKRIVLLFHIFLKKLIKY